MYRFLIVKEVLLILSFTPFSLRAMIELSVWRARIGQFAHDHSHSVSSHMVPVPRDRAHGRLYLTPVCVLVIAAILLRGGDVEQNPGPKRKEG